MSTLTVQNILENRKGWIDLGNAFIAYCKFYKLIESAKLVSGDNCIHYDPYDDDYGDDEGTTSGNIFVRIDVDGKDLPSGTYEISLQGDYNSTFGEAEFLNVSNNRRTEITSDDFRYDEPQTTEEIEIDLVVDKLVSKYFITNKINEDKKMNRKSLRENLFTDKKFPMTVSLDTIEPTVTSYPELSRSEFRNKIVNSDEHFVHRYGEGPETFFSWDEDEDPTNDGAKSTRTYKVLAFPTEESYEAYVLDKEIKTDFDVTNEDFYLNYYTNDLKGWICVDLDKGDVSIESHFENGDYYGPENDSGSLPGGYYDRGYEIDNIDIPTEYMNELFFDEDDNEITKEEFLTLNSMDEKGLDNYLGAAKDELASEIEDYVYNHEEDFIGE